MKYAWVFALLISGFAQGADPQWKIQYFYDKLHETLAIEDLAFPSARHGVGVGAIIDETGAHKPRDVELLTTDGGENWTLQPLHDSPRSIFFLNESTGWMAGDNAIWFTEDSGATWKRIGEQKKPEKKLGPAPPGGLITRLWFLDAQHGFAAGNQKSAFETKDGGKTWTAIAAAAKPAGDPAHAAYTQIAFTGNDGVIMGGAVTPRGDDPHLPSWMEPERAVRRRPAKGETMLIETHDAGKTWSATGADFYGTIISVRLSGSIGLAAFSFNEAFEYPSEVFRLDLKAGQSTQVFRQQDRRVTDVALFAGPRAFLAAVEPPGKLNISPIPGKVRILTSSDMKEWSEMTVDYKASARSVVLAGPDAEHQWAATDTGIILRLE
ncbi:MAG TPA: YCF48-related protein [Bryobacteraceae bacterium]|jgi:hypothetical protein|nr:YCF48-related protein [Bryobacteraceae bacterium]